jgi:asparagine synthase (glutamine-hydrolysing)
VCGIAGFIVDGHKMGPRDVSVLESMVRTIRHRGPDDARTFHDERAALGHARLSIIDAVGGAQPMHNEDGSLAIVFNGEIFNYVELRADLIARGHRFTTRSDTEVILHLFEEDGPAFVSQLNGQWAFAIWSARDQSLFLSRDRLGVRPLFFTSTKDGFVFASEIKALFAYPGIERRLDLRSLQDIFTFWHVLPPRTAFSGISELPPGCSATLARGKLDVRRYWDLEFPSVLPRVNGDGQEERYAEELLAILSDATRIRLRADVPVGAYLSGGLDSSLVAALVRRTGTSSLSTFSVRFDDPALDEGPFQSVSVSHMGTEHRDIRCSAADIGRVFPDVIWHAETPILRTAPAPLYLLSRLVRESGFKVVLTGEGADEMLGGYDIFKEVKIRQFWAAESDSKRRPLLLQRLYPYLPELQSQGPAYLQAFFNISLEGRQCRFFSHLPRWRVASRLKCFFSEAVKAELAGYNPIAALDTLMPDRYNAWNPFVRAQYLESRYLLPGYILSSQGDRVAMAHAVEGRFPFLDHRLVEFAARLPSRMKMKVLKEKYLLKRCAAGLVSPLVLQRHKQPYRAPDAQSFFHESGHDYVEELLSPERIRRDQVFHPAAVEKLVAKARRGNIEGVADNMAIVGILSTQILLDRFINCGSPA